MANKMLRKLARRSLDQFPVFALAWRTHRDSLDLVAEPVQTPLGFKLAGNVAMQRGEFEPEETRLVSLILPTVDILVNVGANIGYYCCMSHSMGKRALAFEPLPLNLKYLMKNVSANGAERSIEIFPLALAEHPSIVNLYGGNTGASLVKGWAQTAEHWVTAVPCNSLDNLIGSRLAGQKVFVLMDIEGAELGALSGARLLLHQDPKPLWMIEICIHEHQPSGTHVNPNLSKTFELFWSAGYDAYTATALPRRVGKEEVRAIAAGGEDSLHTHNFLFAHPSVEQLVFCV